MNLENIQFEDAIFEEQDGSVSFLTSDEPDLINCLNNIRRSRGFIDTICEDADNEVYYDFYLEVNYRNHNVTMTGICKNAEKDDYADYDIPLSDADKKILLWKSFEAVCKEAVSI